MMKMAYVGRIVDATLMKGRWKRASTDSAKLRNEIRYIREKEDFEVEFLKGRNNDIFINEPLF